MPLFQGHHHGGLARLFIEMPDDVRQEIAWKWPDQQIVRHSQVNVDLDYQAVFTNLGKVIGVMGPGRYPLDEGASLALGWLVDRFTDDAYYDAEIYFVSTRDNPDVKFGGPIDSLTDAPTGLVVSLRAFGELAFRVTEPSLLLARLVGTGSGAHSNVQIATWVTDQTMAAIRAVLPDIIAEHGVLAMGRLQDATAQAALSKVNEALSAYGLRITTFGELNVNLPESDARQLKQFAATKAYSSLAGSFDSAVRGEAALAIAGGISDGNVGAAQGLVAGMVMGVPISPAQSPLAATVAGAAPSVGFCCQCGTALAPGAHYCPNCGAAIDPRRR